MKARRWRFSTRRDQAVHAWVEWTHGEKGEVPTQEFAAGFALGCIYRERALAAEGIPVE